MKQYLELLDRVLREGVKKEDRTGKCKTKDNTADNNGQWGIDKYAA